MQRRIGHGPAPLGGYEREQLLATYDNPYPIAGERAPSFRTALGPVFTNPPVGPIPTARRASSRPMLHIFQSVKMRCANVRFASVLSLDIRTTKVQSFSAGSDAFSWL